MRNSLLRELIGMALARWLAPCLPLACLAISTPASAQEESTGEEQRRGEAEGPHHLSLVTGGTYIVETEEIAFTLGVDYEYRVSELLGMGFVLEHAFGEVDATTLLLVADIHLWEGLAVQMGPGVEFAEDEEFLLGRMGVLYEFEAGGGVTIAPQAHYDFSEGEDAIVFAIAIGKAF
jgi:hypothetical protein